MGYVPEWARGNHAKKTVEEKPGIVSKPIFHSENQQHSQGKQTPFTRHYADGSEGGVDSNEDALKQEGLRLSANEGRGGLGGFIDRITAGNIDDPKSEAYNKYGAGRAKREQNLGSGASTPKPKFNEISSGAGSEPSAKAFPTDAAGDDSESRQRRANMGEPAKSQMYTAQPGEGVASQVKPVTSAPRSVAKQPAPAKMASQELPLKDNDAAAARRGSQSFQLQSDTEMLARRQEGVGYKGAPSKPEAPKPSSTQVTERAGRGMYSRDMTDAEKADAAKPKYKPNTENTFLTKERQDAADKSMGKAYGSMGDGLRNFFKSSGGSGGRGRGNS